MRLVMGLDEAGYGPNLGPLVIALTCWSLDSKLDVLRGLEPFAPEFQAIPWNPQATYLPFGDSKKIYHAGAGHLGLWETLRFFCSLSAQDCHWETWAADDCSRVESRPWYASRLEPATFPATTTLENQENQEKQKLSAKRSKQSLKKLSKLGIHFHGFRMRIYDEWFFNQECTRCGNKSNLLGEATVVLAWKTLREFLDMYPGKWSEVEIYFDRQGGRKHYAGLLSHGYSLIDSLSAVPWLEVLEETPRVSRYATVVGETPVSIRFQVEGDSLFPSALASIAAKWSREQLMGRLTRYWKEITGDAIRPTAGYAVDAKRFENEITPWLAKLGVTREQWWRMK
jgi:ribonuclease HII